MLFPDEIHLFKREEIAPSWGVGKNPQDRKFEIVNYQLIEKVCPNYKENVCLIHFKRPLICKAFPIQASPMMIMTDPDCTWVIESKKKNPGSIRPPPGTFPKNSEEVKAWRKICQKVILIYQKIGKVGYHWNYNLDTSKWVMLPSPKKKISLIKKLNQ
jgi:Fe-S-cluster containining protein